MRCTAIRAGTAGLQLQLCCMEFASEYVTTMQCFGLSCRVSSLCVLASYSPDADNGSVQQVILASQIEMLQRVLHTSCNASPVSTATFVSGSTACSVALVKVLSGSYPSPLGQNQLLRVGLSACLVLLPVLSLQYCKTAALALIFPGVICSRWVPFAAHAEAWQYQTMCAGLLKGCTCLVKGCTCLLTGCTCLL